MGVSRALREIEAFFKKTGGVIMTPDGKVLTTIPYHYEGDVTIQSPTHPPVQASISAYGGSGADDYQEYLKVNLRNRDGSGVKITGRESWYEGHMGSALESTTITIETTDKS